MKICFACAIEKPRTEFHRHRGRKDGVNSVCKACHCQRVTLYSRTDGAKAVRAKFWADYKERPDKREKLQDYHRDYAATVTDEQRAKYAETRYRRYRATPRDALYQMLYSASKRRPTENIATVEDLVELYEKQNGLCAVSGFEMIWRANKGGGKQPNSMSLDRIDGKRGYEIDNLRLVCWQVNLFKNCWTEEQMIEMARAIVQRADEQEVIVEFKPRLKLVGAA